MLCHAELALLYAAEGYDPTGKAGQKDQDSTIRLECRSYTYAVLLTGLACVANFVYTHHTSLHAQCKWVSIAQDRTGWRQFIAPVQSQLGLLSLSSTHS